MPPLILDPSLVAPRLSALLTAAALTAAACGGGDAGPSEQGSTGAGASGATSSSVIASTGAGAGGAGGAGAGGAGGAGAGGSGGGGEAGGAAYDPDPEPASCALESETPGSPGSPDLGFGEEGTLLLDADPGNFTHRRHLARAGGCDWFYLKQAIDGSALEVRRYLRNGSIDVGFGAQGIVSYDAEAALRDVLTRKGSHYLLFGDEAGFFSILKLGPDGQPDASFGDGGTLAIALPGFSETAGSTVTGARLVAMAGDGLLVLTSGASAGGDALLALGLDASGNVGTSSWFQPPSHAAPLAPISVVDVLRRTSGAPVVVFEANVTSWGDKEYYLVDVSSSGELDAGSFRELGGTEWSYCSRVLLAGNGVRSVCHSQGSVQIVGAQLDGTDDAGFSNYWFPEGGLNPGELFSTPEFQLVATSELDGGALVRLHEDGTPDPSFGSNGVLRLIGEGDGFRHNLLTRENDEVLVLPGRRMIYTGTYLGMDGALRMRSYWY